VPILAVVKRVLGRRSVRGWVVFLCRCAQSFVYRVGMIVGSIEVDVIEIDIVDDESELYSTVDVGPVRFCN
jgi:hypothetical protein